MKILILLILISCKQHIPEQRARLTCDDGAVYDLTPDKIRVIYDGVFEINGMTLVTGNCTLIKYER